jgi:hypothetical protein
MPFALQINLPAPAAIILGERRLKLGQRQVIIS